ncbi:heme lyase CcmF/NrfE family subunit [Ferrimonas senticii]|uniref:heme lyase CcmF/NrfE family subunit n=1 Tax=Ferrimonas senticii TaxID=394566 RepID=UPI00041AA925|nr:heme lyase NrfEFG subunit NrfE [Ferrimonas senticii]
MAAELGLFLLIIGTVLSIARALLPLVPSLQYQGHLLMRLSASCITVSLLVLGYCFLVDDFSVAYVANHSNSHLAPYFKIAAVWGSHEGSMLLWLTAKVICAVIIDRRDRFGYDASTVMAAISSGFGLFLLLTSNPFARLLPEVPIEGRDLNPMLQNIGLILHPPLVFFGYVAMAVLFAGTCAMLYRAELVEKQLPWLRRWALVGWLLLTGGNLFGSWWAYSQLGWGGWWFWDPVENSSFIPWLISTALLHSLYLNRRGQLQLTTLLLCLLAFCLSLLGTFLVRSGVIQSVHAFAADPSRGYSILLLLAAVTISGFTLFAKNAEKLLQQQAGSDLSGRNGILTVAVVLIVVATVAVVLGTIYPLIFSALNLGAISVGPPYFNAIFVPITIACALLISWIMWPSRPVQIGLAVIAAALASALNWGVATEPYWLLWLGAFGASVLLPSCVYSLVRRNQSWPAWLAHTGLAVAIISATTVSNFEQAAMVQMGPGEGRFVGDIAFVMESVDTVTGRGFTAEQATVRLEDQQGNQLGYLYPQRKLFGATNMQITEAAVQQTVFEDRYLSMGPALESGRHLLRISRKPMINGLWFGGFLMLLGGTVAIAQRRRHVPQADTVKEPACA